MGLFWLGASSSFFIKLISNHTRGKPLHYRPWEYPIMMFVGGVAFMYYDWYRRLLLESVCEMEDLSDSVVAGRKNMRKAPLLQSAPH